MKTIGFVIVLIALAAGGTMYYSKYVAPEASSNFKTVPVKRGDLSITIGATGTLEPEEVVDVGAQVQGRIMEFGVDPRAETDPTLKSKFISYNSPVEEGTVLAIIDPSVYQAALDQAEASYQRAIADLGQLVAKRNQATNDWNRAQKLREIKLTSLSGMIGREGAASTTTIKGISDSDFDLARANYESAKANVDVGNAMVAQAMAARAQAKRSFDFTTIKSPVKGQILDRRVNIGQTVVASLNAPSLFLIAKDLRRMEVWSSVNEADVGRIHLGMPVRFTVDAFPSDVFRGKVAEIRLNAMMTQNVVTYTVVVSTDNSDLKLLPYLTADVKFEIDERSDVLLVPNPALNWQPKPQQIAEDSRERTSVENPSTSEGASSGGGEGRKGRGRGQRGAGGSEDETKLAARPTRGTIWILDDGFVRPIEVAIGATDMVLTEVSSSELTEGMEVVYGENRVDRSADAKNPFAPQFPRGGRGGGRRGGG